MTDSALTDPEPRVRMEVSRGWVMRIPWEQFSPPSWRGVTHDLRFGVVGVDSPRNLIGRPA